MSSTIVTINSSGSDGRWGQDGASGCYGSSHYSEYGVSGDPGEDVSSGYNGEAGQHGAKIDITLRVERLAVVIKGAEGHPSQRLPLGNPLAEIHLKSNGGNGGKGGNGGDGGNGGSGGDGYKATQEYPGGNGGDGGRGGNGGNGGRGGDAGHGGQVIVRVSEKDADLVMLAPQAETKRGLPGQGGKGGTGGSGGSKGRGGAGYAWTTYTDQKVITEEMEYRQAYDSDLGRYVEISYPVKKESWVRVPEEHFQPGGESGVKGSRGSSGYDGRNGSPGEDGSYRIAVVKEDGTINFYPGIYDFRIQTISTIHSPDGVIEPEERVSIENLTLHNTGEMPSPGFQATQVSLRDNQWIHQSSTLRTQRSVLASHLFTFTDSLDFNVRPAGKLIPAIDSTFHQTGIVEFYGSMERVNKPFHAVNQQSTKIQIRYPVEMSIVAHAFAIARNEEVPFAIKIKNISSKSIGLNRLLGFNLGVTEGVDGKDISYRGKKGGNFQSLAKQMGSDIQLNSGEEYTFSATAQFTNPATPVYTKAQLTLSLQLGKCHSPLIKEIIQKRNFKVQLAEYYQFNRQANFLLVVNSEVEARTIKLWQRFARSLGTSIGIWNASLYRGVSLTSELKSEKGNLLTLLKGKTLVFLNAPFPMGGNKKLRATDMLDEMELFRAAKFSGISSYVIGDRFDIGKAVTPLIERRPRIYKTVTKLAQVNPSADHHYKEVVKEKKYLGKLKEKKVIKLAKKKSKKLQKEFPKSRHATFYDYRKTGTFSWELTFQFRPALDSESTGRLCFRNQDMNAFDNYDIYNVFKLLNFDNKLSQISGVIGDDNKLSLLQQAILSDLADEVALFSANQWEGTFDKAKLANSLDVFQKFASQNLTAICRTTEGKEFIKDILLKYRYLAKRLPSTTDNLLLPRFKRRKILSKVCMKKSDALLARLFPFEDFKSRNKALHKKSKNTKRGELLHSFRSPFNVACKSRFDHDQAPQVHSLKNPPKYEERESGFKVGINAFANDQIRTKAMEKYEQACQFDD